MIKTEKTVAFGWEAAIRQFYDRVGVRYRPSTRSYETFISIKCKTVSCGSYKTLDEARDAVISTKINLFRDNVLRYGDNPEEIIPSIENGYFVSPAGNIYNRHGHLMSPAVNRDGYLCTVLNGKSQRVHRVIAESFIPNSQHLPCVNHKDGNKQNNSVVNLEWCTHSENTIHAYYNGLERKMCGEQHHSHKLTEDDVRYIRKVYVKRDSEFGATALSKKFHVDRTTIDDVVNKRSWRRVQ